MIETIVATVKLQPLSSWLLLASVRGLIKVIVINSRLVASPPVQARRSPEVQSVAGNSVAFSHRGQ